MEDVNPETGGQCKSWFTTHAESNASITLHRNNWKKDDHTFEKKFQGYF